MRTVSASPVPIQTPALPDGYTARWWPLDEVAEIRDPFSRVVWGDDAVTARAARGKVEIVCIDGLAITCPQCRAEFVACVDDLPVLSGLCADCEGDVL